MLRFILVSVASCFFVLSSNSDIYSAEEKRTIFAYPTDNGTLDWSELKTRFDDSVVVGADLMALEDLYAASIAAIRTGDFDSAPVRAARLQSIAPTPLWRTRSNLLVRMIAFYQGDSAARDTLSEALRDDLAELSEADGTMDWIAGTTVSLLFDYHLKGLDTDAAAATLRVSEPLAKTLGEFEGHVWVTSKTLTLGFTHALSSSVDRRQQAATQASLAGYEVGRALNHYGTDDQFDLLKKLYFRTVVFEAANSAYAGTEGIDITSNMPMYFEFYPDFQTECVASYDFVDLSFRRRDYSATGGVVIKVQVNNKGRGKFVSVVDGMPDSITHGGMLGLFKRQTRALRVEFEEDRPTWCDQGGEMLIRLSYSWER